MRYLTLVILLMASNVAASQWLSYEVHLTSTHIALTKEGREMEFNPNNLGLGLMYRYNTDNAIVFGNYLNSFHKSTTYIGISHAIDRTHGYEIGLATGYDDLYGLALTPIALLYVKPIDRIKLRIIPGGVFAITISYSF